MDVTNHLFACVLFVFLMIGAPVWLPTRTGRPYDLLKTCFDEAFVSPATLALKQQEGRLRPDTHSSLRLRQSGAQEGQDAVAGDVAEGRQFERVVAAVELEAARMSAVAAQGVEHLAA
jgi:hypothetical protein